MIKINNTVKSITKKRLFTPLIIVLLLIVIVLSTWLFMNIGFNDSVTNNEKQMSESMSELVSESVSESSNFLQILDCLNIEWAEQNNCYDKFIASYAKNKTIGQVLADLDATRAQNTSVENNCHPMAHAVGRYAMQKFGNVGDAFKECDFTCHSGCYHGVMERLFFNEEEILRGVQHLSLDEMRDRIPGICDRDQFSNPTDAIVFQCLHGVGHAILYTINYDLLDALKACDLLETEYEQTSCYGGVVMENVTAFDKNKRDIDPQDPLHPCNSLPRKYQYSCYLMQTSIMLELGVPPSEQAKACLGAEEDGVVACHISLGRDLSNNVRAGQIKDSAGICQQAGISEEFTRNCVDGAIYALIDNTWDAKYAFSFCNALKDNNVAWCYQDALDYLEIYNHDLNSKLEQCKKFARENKQLCNEKVR